jgi:transposase
MIKELNLRAKQIGGIVGVSERTVNQWVYYYNKKGEAGIKSMLRGGRRENREIMSIEQEKAFLDTLISRAEKGLIIITKTIKEEVEKYIGKGISLDYVYDLLHRNNWRKVTPRPRHPKTKIEVQEEFKKNFQSYWRPPLRVSE